MPEASSWDPVAAQALELLRAGRQAEAFTIIDRQAAAMAGAGAPAPGPNPGFRDVGLLVYWIHRALPEFLVLQREHLRRLEAALAACTAPEERAPLVRAIGGSNYNLASFAWPGWGEPAITIGPGELEAGREAAARCLAIRLDPAHEGVPFSYTLEMAHWVAGAYHLADRQFAAARAQFDIARQRAQEEGGDGLLAEGYLALTSLLERPGDASASTAFEAVLVAFNARTGDEDAAFYRDQLLTCRRVFA
jgi:hypothetical protein